MRIKKITNTVGKEDSSKIKMYGITDLDMKSSHESMR
jgi:hypothetical protein